MIQENYRIISLSLLFFYRILLFFLVCYRIVKDLGIIKVFVNVILLLAMSTSERTTFSRSQLFHVGLKRLKELKSFPPA